LEETDTQGNLRWQPIDEQTAERVYERKWAMTLLNLVLTRLEADYARRSRTAMFHHLQPCLLEPDAQPRYAEIARLLDMTDASVRKEVSRMRHRFREFFREEIANTVNGPDEIDGEMRYLFAVLSK
jgi:RNA polymerase sigma-70 factor (ECF subfamily)